MTIHIVNIQVIISRLLKYDVQMANLSTFKIFWNLQPNDNLAYGNVHIMQTGAFTQCYLTYKTNVAIQILEFVNSSPQCSLYSMFLLHKHDMFIGAMKR